MTPKDADTVGEFYPKPGADDSRFQPSARLMILLNQANCASGMNVFYLMWKDVAELGIAQGLLELVKEGNYEYTVRTTKSGEEYYCKNAAPVGEW